MRKTNEGGNQYEHSLDHALEFFSKSGSLFKKRDSFYGQEESALSLFQKSWIVDKPTTMALLFWLRDIRGGAGNRSGARDCYEWLAKNDPDWLRVNLQQLPELGRWDDLRSLFGTKLEGVAAGLWADEIAGMNVLAAKWADRKDKPLRHYIGMNEADFRRFLSSVRKNHIVEHKMCSDNWNEVEYEKVPSVAMSRYTNAFKKHDEERFNSYKESLKSGETTVHASVLFPHDCVRTSLFGDTDIADAQFDALPNYMEGTDERIIVIADTSGSMCTTVSGSVEAVHVSQGMALYCSSKIPWDNPFYKKFIGFSNEGRFVDWNGFTFSEAIGDRSIFNGAVGSTRINNALNLILKTAKFFNLPDSMMPTSLIIVSDMQFHRGVDGDGTEVDKALKLWTDNGYNRPKIIYWNTAGYTGSVDTCRSKNVALVSGFSPSILKSIFTGDDLSPIGVMMKTIEKYVVNIP